MLLRVLLALLLPLIMAGSGPVNAQSKKAPNFKLKTVDGKEFELSKLMGKVVVVNFWATWCGPCRSEIPGFLEFYKSYKTKGVEIVGISLDTGGWELVRPFVEKYKITYPVVIGDGPLADAYGGVDAIPLTFFVDKKGVIAKRHVGYLQKNELEKIVKELL